jgi:hypothetical protein
MGDADLTKSDRALLSALEAHIAIVAKGNPSRFVLLVCDDAERLVTELERTGNLVARVNDSLGAVGDCVRTALVERLVERRSDRPGAAHLVDPLVARAAEYVLGTDLPSLTSYLTPEALDEVPAIAGRVLVQRFVPALAAIPMGAPESLVEALVRERCGYLEGRPGLGSAVMGDRDVDALLGIAAYAEHAVVLWHGFHKEGAVALAHEIAVATRRRGAVALFAVSQANWDIERVLLSNTEKQLLEQFLVSDTPPTNAPTSAQGAVPPECSNATTPPSAGPLGTEPVSVTLIPQPLQLQLGETPPQSMLPGIEVGRTLTEESGPPHGELGESPELTHSPETVGPGQGSDRSTTPRQRTSTWPGRVSSATMIGLLFVPAGIAGIWVVSHLEPLRPSEDVAPLTVSSDGDSTMSSESNADNASIGATTSPVVAVPGPIGTSTHPHGAGRTPRATRTGLDRIQSIDAALQDGRRAQALADLGRMLDEIRPIDSESRDLRLALIARLTLCNEPSVLDRLLSLAEPATAPRLERLAALRALVERRPLLDEVLRARVARLAEFDADDEVRRLARAASG